MYSETELILFNKKIESIIDKSQEESDKILNPNLTQRKNIINIIEKYIKKNKLIIYGGNAQNLAIKKKDPNEIIYTNNSEIHDYDIYSYEPLKHVVIICNLIYEAGFKNIRCIEALHPETYSIKYDQYTFMDLTYMPTLLYKNLTFLVVDNFRIIDPYFTYIDFMRIFTDSLITSSFRWDKHFERFNKLQQFYPFINTDEKINYTLLGLDKPMNKQYRKIIRNYMKNNLSLLMVGINVYNKYIKLNTSKLNNKINKINETYIEIISTNYIQDVKNFLNHLKTKTNKEIKIKERYPFFQFRDYSTEIYIDDVLTFIIYGNNYLCVPYVIVNGIKYTTFHYNIMWFLIEKFYKELYGLDINNTEIIKKHTEFNYEYNKIISNLIELKSNYLKSNKLTFLDNSIYQDFIIQCNGKPKTGNEIKQENLNYIGFKYEPSRHKKINIENWKFRNTTGRYIKNIKNLKIK